MRKVSGNDMEAFTQAVSAVSDFLWNNLLLFLLCGTGIFFTIRLGFVQVRKFGAGVKNLFGRVQPARQGGRQGRHEQLSGADHRGGGTLR